MSVSLVFDLNLKERVSAGLDNIKGKSKATFDGVDKDITKTSKHLTDLGKPTKLTIDTGGIKTAQKEVESLKRSMDEVGKKDGRMGGMWEMAKGSLIARGGEMAIRKAWEMGKEALSFGNQMENSIVGLGNFVGDKEARGIVERVVKEGVYTPYKTSQLLPIEQGLIASAGVDKDRAHRDTWSLANVVAGVGGGDWALERMGVMHLPQIAAAGYMEGMQRREFAVAKIPIDKILSDYLKVPQSKIKDMVSDQKITYNVLTDALYKASQKGGMFAGAMDKLSQTVGGKWSTVMDKFEIAEWKMTESQSRNIKELEDRMGDFADKLPTMAASMAGDFNEAFRRFDELTPSFSKFGGDLAEFLKPVKDLALSKEIPEFIKTLADLGHNITNDIAPEIKQLGEAAQWGIKGFNKELNYYQSGYDLFQRARPFNRREDEGGSGMVNFLTNAKGWIHDFNTLSFGLLKDKDVLTAKGKEETKNNYDAYKGLGSWMMGGNPNKGDDKHAPAKYSGAVSEASDAIVRGGSKQINININAPMYKVDHQTFNTVKDALNDMEPKIKEVLERILYSVPAY